MRNLESFTEVICCANNMLPNDQKRIRVNITIGPICITVPDQYSETEIQQQFDTIFGNHSDGSPQHVLENQLFSNCISIVSPSRLNDDADPLRNLNVFLHIFCSGNYIEDELNLYEIIKTKTWCTILHRILAALGEHIRDLNVPDIEELCYRYVWTHCNSVLKKLVDGGTPNPLDENFVLKFYLEQEDLPFQVVDLFDIYEDEVLL